MISNEEIYVVKGKQLKTIINLLYDLKYVAIEYAKFNETNVEETETFYTNFIENVLQSKLFKNLKLVDLQQEFSFSEMLSQAGIKLQRRK
jgi:hypothetical protein|tara:strand:+ start:187 stop:456 length:270 start_codon:yes stop_codon:yes gene_type:complete